MLIVLRHLFDQFMVGFEGFGGKGNQPNVLSSPQVEDHSWPENTSSGFSERETQIISGAFQVGKAEL